MKDIMSLLRQKEEQLKLLARQVDALRVAAQLMAEEQRLVGGLPESEAPTQPEMIRTVLAEKGDPMHISKISEAIRKKYNKRFKALYLTSIIYRAIKKGKLFYKVSERPSTYGLIEWQVGKTIQMPLEVNVGSR
jgi:hypothetical protein